MISSGEVAGKIWRILSERGRLSIRKIGELTSLNEAIIFLGIGWLARENKINFYNRSGMLYVELK